MPAAQLLMPRVFGAAAIRFLPALTPAAAAAVVGTGYVRAAPAAVAMVGLAAPSLQLEIAQPSGADTTRNWSHRGRGAIARMRHARAARQVRMRRARAELAHMARRGQEFCLATAVYFEARDEPLQGQRAVAAVILARAHTAGRPKTVCGVVFQGAWRRTGCQFSFACDGRTDVPHWRSRWLRAQRSAAYVWRHQRQTRGMVRGATFYHTKFVHPRWDKQMVRVARIGLHIFYRPRHGRLS